MSFDNQDNNKQEAYGQNRNSYSTPNSNYTPSPYLPSDPPANIHPQNSTNQTGYYSGYASYRQAAPETNSGKESGGRKSGSVLKTLAAFMAVAVVAGASGGGVTYVMMRNNVQDAINQQPFTSTTDDVASSQTTTPSTSSSQAPVINSNGATTDLADIIENAAESVVEIEIEMTATSPFFGEYTSPGGGSGIVLTSDGYIATNNHVTESATKLTVRTPDGSEYEAVLVGSDSQTDLSVIKIEAEGLSPITFGDSESIRVGEVAIAIGNPLGTLGGTVTTGIISAKEREVSLDTGETMNLIQTSAAVNPGNSGGGLFDSNGKLIGIVNAKPSGGTEGLGFAIPSNLVKSVTDSLISDGYVKGRPEIGITPIEILTAEDVFRYRVSEPGVYIYMVSRENGLEVSDMIVSIDGEVVESRADITDALSKKSAGDIMEIVVKRDGVEVTVNVTLTEKIPEHIKAKLESVQPF